MNESDLKVLTKQGICGYEGNCYFKKDGDCYKKSYCNSKQNS